MMILMVDGLQQAGSKVQDSGRPHSTLASFYLPPHSLPTNQPTPGEQIYGKHIHSSTQIVAPARFHMLTDERDICKSSTDIAKPYDFLCQEVFVSSRNVCQNSNKKKTREAQKILYLSTLWKPSEMCRENNVDVVNFRRAEGRKRHSRIYKCRQHEVIWTNSLIYICPMLKFPASVGDLLSGLSQLHTTRRQQGYQPAEIYQHSFRPLKAALDSDHLLERWSAGETGQIGQIGPITL